MESTIFWNASWCSPIEVTDDLEAHIVAVIGVEE
jgi:hypothetical protein